MGARTKTRQDAFADRLVDVETDYFGHNLYGVAIRDSDAGT